MKATEQTLESYIIANCALDEATTECGDCAACDECPIKMKA